MASRVMSIQSHVVSGYVGNKSATFPLQLLQFDVDVINSVHFSNHTGHPCGFEGDVLQGDQLRSILKGLQRNGLLEGIGHLLTGYIGSESFLRAVLDVLKTLRSRNNGVCRYVCDPVLGDYDGEGEEGRFYCPPQLADIFRDEVLPLANVVTPNRFEAEQLTGIKIRTLADAQSACKTLHDLGPELVFITSAIFDGKGDHEEAIDSKEEKLMTILASKRTSSGDAKRDEIWRIDSPIIDGTYTGTGDLCAALLLAWTEKESNLQTAMEKVAGTMYSVIKATSECSGKTVASRELRLIQSKNLIENPPALFTASRVE
jgi:pyridoxine kinase